MGSYSEGGIMKKGRRQLKVPRGYERLLGEAVTLDTNVLLYGYPGGIRHEPLDLKAVLKRYGFQAEGNTIYKSAGDDMLFVWSEKTLRESLAAARKEFPELTSLYRATGRDPIGETQDYIEAMGYPHSVEEYLFGGDLPDEEVGTRLEVSRVYRSAMGLPLDVLTKWAQTDRWGDGYVAWKFDVQAGDADVYHPGAGNYFGQTVRGIKTTGKIRCTDPQRDGTRIEWNPPEEYCVSDCAYGDDVGMISVKYFYAFYDNWRKRGKKVWFKADMLDPPKFPYKVIRTDNRDTRIHNIEFIGYTDLSIADTPEYESYMNELMTTMRCNMSRANVIRNKKTRDGDVEWPMFDKDRVEQLLFDDMDYNIRIPEKVDLIQRIVDKARFPITRKNFGDRAKSSRPAPAFTGIAASIMIFLFGRIRGRDEGPVEIDMLTYPYFANHQFIEEALWGFEECISKLGLERNGTKITGHLTLENRKIFGRLIEKTVANH